MSRLVDGIKPYVIGTVAIVAGVTVLPQVSHRVPDAPAAVFSVADPGSDCRAEVVAEDGTPPPGTPRLDPQKLCDALDQAEKDAACVGDWNPPDPVNARAFCVELHRRGCGDPTRDCAAIPADQTYYTHH